MLSNIRTARPVDFATYCDEVNLTAVQALLEKLKKSAWPDDFEASAVHLAIDDLGYVFFRNSSGQACVFLRNADSVTKLMQPVTMEECRECKQPEIKSRLKQGNCPVCVTFQQSKIQQVA